MFHYVPVETAKLSNSRLGCYYHRFMILFIDILETSFLFSTCPHGPYLYRIDHMSHLHFNQSNLTVHYVFILYSWKQIVSFCLNLSFCSLIFHSSYLSRPKTISSILHVTLGNWLTILRKMSHLMRLWYFSSYVNSFFKCACAAIQWR